MLSLSNLYIFILLYFILYLFLNFRHALNMLFLTEFIWIALYLSSVVYGYTFNDINTLSLSFFILIFSAFEFSFGFILFSAWQKLNHTLNLTFLQTQVKKKLNAIYLLL